MPGVMASLAGISPFPATLTIDGHHHNHHHCHTGSLLVMVVTVVMITRIVMVAGRSYAQAKGVLPGDIPMREATARRFATVRVQTEVCRVCGLHPGKGGS